ncbi:MAG: hypothetical protein O3B01_19655 [Planctomycetota bacterium]|nr:hypothetical protein [Planctomycetota bacterium]MDA1140788.1 hypothetical protein [Planctomycetota bacterium]
MGILTSNIQAAIASTDYMLQDWSSAGLQKSSAFRSYFGMAMPSAVRVIGKLSARDWDEVAKCVETAFA